MVQWLGLHASTVGARVRSLVRELRSCKLCGMAAPPPSKKKERKKHNSVVLIRGAVVPPGDIGQCLETFVVVTTRGGGAIGI